MKDVESTKPNTPDEQEKKGKKEKERLIAKL